MVVWYKVNLMHNGGEKFAVGGRVVELEGGEAVINKRSTSMFRNQLSAMNAAGGGVKFADGGLMNMPSFAQSQFNATSQAGMMGAIGQGGKSSSSRIRYFYCTEYCFSYRS